MKKNAVRLLVILISTLLMAACAAPFSASKEANANEAKGTQSFGLGYNASFAGEGADDGPTAGLLGERTFHFKFDSAQVESKDLPAIKAHARYLIQHPDTHVLLAGNTDNRGSREYNIALGQRRADAVAQILKMQGVNPNQIREISYGQEKPVATGNTERDYYLNRRVDLRYE